METPKKQKILVLGNGFNLAFVENSDEYITILSSATKLAKEMAIEAKIFNIGRHVDGTLPKDISEIDNTVFFRPSQIKDSATPDEKRAVNFYNKMRVWDSETIFSLYFVSKFFQGKTLKEKIKEEIKTKVRESIIDKMNAIPNPKFMYKDALIKKLNEYDFILTTNYDMNVESLKIKGKVVHLHGSKDGQLQDLKMGPFADIQSITTKVTELGIDFGTAELDIFGLSMITEPHIFITLFKKSPKILHYVYNLDDERDRENIWELVNKFLGSPIGSDIKGELLSAKIKNDAVGVKRAQKALDFIDSYKQFPSSEFLESSDVDGVNETMMPSTKGIWD